MWSRRLTTGLQIASCRTLPSTRDLGFGQQKAGTPRPTTNRRWQKKLQTMPGSPRFRAYDPFLRTRVTVSLDCRSVSLCSGHDLFELLEARSEDLQSRHHWGGAVDSS